ncbi:apolipoprotein N-acyltransferase [Vibrio cholerae]|nr:apolipoprotein N-acyltransferase [Vibrio cholerae]ELE5867580.1 apolipoprotein N-acyltransferase [Vibrio cholerae]ELG7082837.1 apolipoprotein N-acyltransferase [Vibrio cholerae]
MNSVLSHRLMRPLAAAFVGVITPLAFAPYQFWPLALLSPFILLLLLHQQSAKRAALIAYLWGIGQFAVGISWVHVSIDTFGGMPKIASLFLMTLLVGYLALYPSLFGWLLNRFFPNNSRSKWLCAAPALWLITDWLRGWVMTGFPWLWLGYSQIDSPLANFAPIGGVELITLLLLFCAGSLAYAVLNRRWLMACIPLVVYATGYGLQAMQWVTPQTERTASLALIQGNIEQGLKWLPSQRWPTIMKYTDLTRENWDADVIIWPEAAIPAFEYEISSFLHNLDAAARMNQSAVITGIINQSEDKQYFNSVLTVGDTPHGEYRYDLTQRYHKYHLLPFGEFVPFEEILRPLAPFFNLPMSSFSQGAYVQPNLIAKGFAFVTALCYEIIFNEQVRDNVTPDTDFLLTLSNDAWFGRSIGPLQHMEIARMRALELGKPLVRATNNGVTAVTDERGRIMAQLPQFETGVLKATVTPTRGSTPYFLWGTTPLYLSVGLAIGFAFWRQRRAR